MASIALPSRQTSTLRSPYWPALAVALLSIVAVAVNPAGFLGVGNDDAQYLEAARCWVASGNPCVPTTHWASRWPVVAPLALTTATFGESRLILGLGPLLYWAASIALIGWLAERWFDRTAGYLAAALLAVTPTFTAAALQPSADVAELAWQVAALAAATAAFQRQSRSWSLAAGAMAGLALATRDTSVLFVAAAALAWLFLPTDRRQILLWAIPGLLAVVLGEMLVYAISASDPLLRSKLAAAHVTIPSTELSPGVDTRSAPFFNPSYIAGWKREMGIQLFWPIDPWLNLVTSPKIMQTLIAPAVLALAYWAAMPLHVRRSLKLLVGCAIFIALLLVYGLAIDPKPRMFLPLAATGAIAAGVLAGGAWEQRHRLLPAFVLWACAVNGVFFLSQWAATYQAESRARQWIAEHGNEIEVEPTARGYLMLVPEARALPAPGSGRALLLSRGDSNCTPILPRSVPRDRLHLIHSQGGPNPGQERLCLWRYR